MLLRPNPRRSATAHRLLTAALLLFLVASPLPGIAATTSRARVATAFLPNCEKLLLNELKKARQSVRVAIYTLTRDEIVDALIKLADDGVDIKMKADAGQSDIKTMQSQINRLRRHGISVDLIETPKSYYTIHMHHKFAIIDRKVVLTGSYNWTTNASEKNWENLVMIESRGVAAEFIREWERLRDRQ